MDFEDIKRQIGEIFKYKSLEELLNCFRKLNHLLSKLSYNNAKELLNTSNLLRDAFNSLIEFSKDENSHNIIGIEYFGNRSFSLLLDSFLERIDLDIEDFLDGKLKPKKRVLTSNETIQLIDRVRMNDQEARTILVEKNVGLVKTLASYYVRFAKKMDYDDLYQEGMLGLLRAIDDFEYERGYKFSTYATYWIRSKISRSMNEFDRTVKLPINKLEKIRKMNEAQSALSIILNREPEPEEIAERMGLAVEEIRDLITYSDDAVSLDSKVGDDKESELMDFVSSDEIPLESTVIQREYSEKLWKVIESVLDKREYDVISKRMGHFDGNIYSLEEIASQYHVTKARIGQIENKAISKLRKPSVRKLIEEFDHSTGIQNRFNNTKKDAVEDSIVKLFGGRNIDLIRGVIESFLSEEEKSIIYLRYGKDLCSVNQIDKNESELLSKVIIPKLYDALKSINKFKLSSVLNNLFPDYNVLEIRLAIMELKKEFKEYMFSMFGIDLMKENDFNHEQIKFFNTNIYHLIKENLEKNRGLKVLLSDIFPDIDSSLLKRLISLLPITNQRIMYNRFGKYLDELNVIKPEEKRRLYTIIIPEMNAMIHDEYLFMDNYCLFSHFTGFDKDEVIETIDLLAVHDQKLIYRRFGKDLMEVKPINIDDYDRLYNHLIPNLIKILRKEITLGTSHGKTHKELFDFFPDYSKEDVINVISGLPNFYKELIYKRYGENLDGFNSVSNRELSIITGTVFRRIETILRKDAVIHSEKTFIEIFKEYSVEEITDAIDILSNGEKILLIKKYGEDLDDVLVMLVKEEENMIPKVLDKVNRYLKGKTVNGKRNNSLSAQLGISKAELFERLKYLSEDEKDEVYVYCGYDLNNPQKPKLPVSRIKYIEEHIIMKLKKDLPSIIEYEKAKRIAKKVLDNKLLSFEIDLNALIYLILRHSIGFSKTFPLRNIVGYVGLTLAEGAELEKRYYQVYTVEFENLMNKLEFDEYTLVKKSNN